MVDRYGFRDRDFDRPNKNSDNVFQSKDKAILVLLEPIEKQFGDVGYRPMLYNFDRGEMKRRGEDLLIKSGRGAHSVDDMAASMFRGLDATASMTPSLKTNGLLKASHLNEKHRFILILTTSARGRIQSNTRILNRNTSGMTRRIYSGICDDIPVERGLFGRDKTLNPNCRLQVMRKVVTEIGREDTARGSITNLNNRFNDEVINPSLIDTLRTSREKGIELLLPERVSGGIVASDDQIASAPGLATDISDEKEEIIFSNTLENPRNHLDTLSRAFTLMVDDKEAADRVSNRRDSAWDMDNEHSLELRTSSFQNYLHVPTSGMIDEDDLDLHDTILLGDIDDRFDPEVIEIDIENALMYDVADHGEGSLINQYSYLIAIVTPTILSSLGLNKVQFVYSVERRPGGMPDESFRIRETETVYDVSNSELDGIERAFRSEMRKSCLDHIFATIQDFHLVCTCDVTGFTTIRLNPVALGMRNDVDFEMPTLLGGNISPMIGSTVDAATNTDSLVDVWQTLLGNNDDDPDDNGMFERPELLSRPDNYGNNYQDGDDDDDWND